MSALALHRAPPLPRVFFGPASETAPPASIAVSHTPCGSTPPVPACAPLASTDRCPRSSVPDRLSRPPKTLKIFADDSEDHRSCRVSGSHQNQSVTPHPHNCHRRLAKGLRPIHL